jgi:hypothetical protein
MQPPVPVKRRKTDRRAAALLLSLLVLILMSIVGTGLHHTTVQNFTEAYYQQEALSARMAAESGISYYRYALDECTSDPMNPGQIPDMLEVVRDYINNEMSCGTAAIYGSGTDRRVSVPEVDLGSKRFFAMDLYVQQEDQGVPTECFMVVTGRSGSTTRRVGMQFNVEENRELLRYAVASSVRVIARGNVKVHGPVLSTWGRLPRDDARNKRVYPLDVQLGSEGFISGGLATTLSQTDFTGDADLGDYDFHNGIYSDNDNCSTDWLRSTITYNAPEVMNLDIEDFDTSPLKAMTSTDNLPQPDATHQSLGMWGLYGSVWENYDGEEDDDDKPALNNIMIPKGTNPHFKNCRFTGITYIEVDEGGDINQQNGVVFENCTFDGPIITGVPPVMHWEKNSMEFRGDTTFNASMIDQALGGVTLMAPNYNVNIGGGEGGGGYGESTVYGLVIGGVVDIYNNLQINGTLVSMADLVVDGQIIMGKGTSWLTGTGVSGTNLGNLDGTSQDIEIWPDPHGMMPQGIKKRYLLQVVPTTYVEYIE